MTGCCVKIWTRFKGTIKTSYMNVSSQNLSVQFSHSVMTDSLRPHEPQHARPPCPSPTPGVHPNPCPSSWWCHPTISSSVVCFSSCPQSFPASGAFQMSQLFASGGHSTGVSASTSVLPVNTQDWSPLGWTGWISLQSKGLSRVFSKPQFKSINSLALSFLYSPTLTSIHDCWRNHSFDWMDLCWQSNISVDKAMLLRLVMTFIPRSKHLLISWLQSPSAVILEPPKTKVWHCFHCFPIHFPWSDRTRCHDLSFLNVEL